MTLQKADAIGSLSEVVKHSRESNESHRNQLHYFQRFIDMLVRLVRKQAPDLLLAIRYVVAPFTTAINHELVILQAESREAEDLYDLSARYEVLLRQWSEYIEITKKVKDIRERIARLRRELELEERRGGPKQYKLKSDIAESLDKKKRYVEEGQAKLEQILVARQAYYAFSVRRLKHAYVNHGKVLEVESHAIAAAFSDLQSRINEIRENIDAILDGTYPLPEVQIVSNVPRTTGEEEEEEAPSKGKQTPPADVQMVTPPPAPLGDLSQLDPRPRSAFESSPSPYEPAPYEPKPFEPTPYEPKPYGQDPGYDDSPFPPE
jgi:hypothetical protein